ncbi:MAG: protein kinase [Reyranellaceae bacterium]
MAADNPSDNARTRVVESGAPLALSIGTLLGRYRIDGVLGQGGFGITYRAADTALNRSVAIKEYLPADVAIRIDGTTVIPRSRTDAEDYDWGLRRFLDEAKTLAQHEAVPNVVRVYDFVEANGTAYMVMALVEGDNLSTILRQRGTLDERELRAIALPLLNGLEQLHEAGVIHRDIKPANIILRGGREPTLIDFGAAREGLGRKSRSVTSILTPGYAPFEQYGSAGDQGPWTDIYALAATLYHGIAGKPPPDSVDRIRRDPMVPATQAGAGRYGADLLNAIDAGLKVDERERPQSVAQWRAMFGAAAVTAPPFPTAPSTQPTLQQPVSQPSGRSAPVEPPPPPSFMAAPPSTRGSRKVALAVGIVALLVAGGGAIALTLGSGGSPETAAARPDPAALQLAAAEKKRTAELEARLAEEAANRKKLEQQIAETEARRKADEEARRQAAEDARLKAEEQARLKAETEAREKAEAETRRRIEEEARRKVEAEYKARAEEEARRQAEEARLAAEEARRKAAEEARLKAEAEAREKAEAENRRRIEEDARKKVEAEYRAKAEEEARRRQAEEAKKKAEDEAKKKAENEARKKAEDEARKKAEQQKPAGTQVAAATPQAQQQTAAAAPVADPESYVAQHWPTALRPKVEAALKQRGVVTDTVSGTPMRFDQIYSYRLVRVTPAQVVLTVTYRNVRAVPGGGNMTGTSADMAETAIFQNQPPDFPLASLK